MEKHSSNVPGLLGVGSFYSFRGINVKYQNANDFLEREVEVLMAFCVTVGIISASKLCMHFRTGGKINF